MDTPKNNDGKGRFLQTVTVKVEVLVNSADDDLNRVSVDDLRAAIEDRVRQAQDWNAMLVGGNGTGIASVSADRGPGGSRYYFPTEANRNVDLLFPLQVDLADLNVPTYVVEDR